LRRILGAIETSGAYRWRKIYVGVSGLLFLRSERAVGENPRGSNKEMELLEVGIGRNKRMGKTDRKTTGR
jgi:hypothetical protein